MNFSRFHKRGGRTLGLPRTWCWSFLSIVLLTGTWHVAAQALPDIILPSLASALSAFTGLLAEPSSYAAALESLGTFVLALAIAALLGTVIGITSGLNASVRAALAPILAICNAVPSVAWMGLAMIWFGLGAGPTGFLVVVTTMPILASALQTSVHTRDPKLEELASVFALPRGAKLCHVTLPPLVSSARAALIAMAGLGWKLTIMGEFLTASRGLGEQLVIAKAHMQTDRVIAITLFLVFIWVLIEAMLRLLAKIRFVRSGTAFDTSAHDPRRSVAGKQAPLHCRDLSFGYPGNIVARDISFDVAPGSVTAVLGPSGIGKSSLLHVLGGITPPLSGSVEGATANNTSWVFQEDRLLPWRTLLENVALFAGVSEQLAREQLTALGLGGACERLPGELSGGMRRRGALARAFLRDSQLLLLDEPFTGLDVRRRIALIDDIRDMRAARKQTIVFVTHDVEDALLLADEALVLGGVPCAEVVTHLDLRQLGEDRSLEDPALATARQVLLGALLRSPEANSADRQDISVRSS